MTQDLIRQAGEALYGERWKTALAKDLGVSRDSVNDWSSDPPRMNPRPGVYDDLRALLEARRAEIAMVIEALEA